MRINYSLSFGCLVTVNVLCLFMQCVVVIFSVHTHLLFVKIEFIVIYWFFLKSTIPNISLRNSIKVPNSLDPDQAQYFVGHNLCSISLQMLKKTLAIVKKVSSKTYGLIQHIWSLVILCQDCFCYANLSKMATRVICMSVHLFVCESVIVLSYWSNLVQSWFKWQI